MQAGIGVNVPGTTIAENLARQQLHSRER